MRDGSGGSTASSNVKDPRAGAGVSSAIDAQKEFWTMPATAEAGSSPHHYMPTGSIATRFLTPRSQPQLTLMSFEGTVASSSTTFKSMSLR